MATNPSVIRSLFFKHTFDSLENRTRTHLKEVTPLRAITHIYSPAKQIPNLCDVTELSDNIALVSGLTLALCLLWLLTRAESTESNRNNVAVHVFLAGTRYKTQTMTIISRNTDCEKMLLTSAPLHTNFG